MQTTRAQPLAVLVALVLLGCDGSQLHTGGPHYFKRFRNGSFPWEPIEALSKAEADHRVKECWIYVVAHFDKDGRVLRAERWHGDRRVIGAEYTYDNKGQAKEVSRLRGTEGRCVGD